MMLLEGNCWHCDFDPSEFSFGWTWKKRQQSPANCASFFVDTKQLSASISQSVLANINAKRRLHAAKHNSQLGKCNWWRLCVGDGSRDFDTRLCSFASHRLERCRCKPRLR